MRNHIVAILAASSCVAALAACSTTHTTHSQPAKNATLSWQTVHTSSNPRELLVDVAESTRDPRSPCWTTYRARAIEHTHTISIALVIAKAPTVVCANRAVIGPFYAAAQLSNPYHDQHLLDAATRSTRQLSTKINLATLPVPPS